MDEESLVHAAKRGDLDAFNRLVIEYQSRAYNLAYRFMSDPASAADVTQDAFISAFRGIGKFRGGSFRSWLLRIVVNTCYDELRRRKRRPAYSLDEFSDDGDRLLVEAGTSFSHESQKPEQEVERSELRAAIEQCFDELPPEFKAVAVLVDIQGFDYKEAARVISKPVGTVKSRLARARGRLRECLNRRGELLPSRFRLDDETI
ncbi:MAG: sigma-70 family RNA polymerase sigma factor [Anaerolineales bacterium]|nr:MAG: sigma-70 family RNA polymerase sigma factor [Anaerolineales bacterium]